MPVRTLSLQRTISRVPKLKMSAERDPSATETEYAKAEGLAGRTRAFYFGVVILVAGLIGSALVYLFGADGYGGDVAGALGNRRASEFQIERIGGMATVYVARFNLWFTSLWHGKQLALTVGVLAVVVAFACF